MSLLRSGIDMYTLYSIIKKLSTPFTEWKAYKLGVIDEKGNILIPVKQRNQEQYYSLTYLDIFVRNLKMILQKVPGLNNRFVTYAAALWLLKEDRYIKMDLILEDGESAIPPNNMSSGHIANSSEKEAFSFNKKIIKKYKKLEK